MIYNQSLIRFISFFMIPDFCKTRCGGKTHKRSSTRQPVMMPSVISVVDSVRKLRATNKEPSVLFTKQ